MDINIVIEMYVKSIGPLHFTLHLHYKLCIDQGSLLHVNQYSLLLVIITDIDRFIGSSY